MIDVHHPEITDVIRRALAEDLGSGDVTSNACVPEDRIAEGTFFAREGMVVCGTELLPLIFDEEELHVHVHTSECANAGERIAQIRGRARRLLERERVSLNLLQRLSGIATLARRYVAEVAGTQCRVLDTRKTTPGLRRLEKWAVAAGGAMNHRMGLYDAVLIKNNHIVAAGGIRPAVDAARATGLPIEVEVRTRDEIDEALASRAVRLLFDNMTPEQAAEEIRHVNGRAQVELSGGITLENIRNYAETGADFISVGAITHSARAVDINFHIILA